MKLMQLQIIAFLILVLNHQLTYGNALQSNDSLVCDEVTCRCDNTPAPAGVMISHVHNKGQWMISYRLMSMTMSGVIDGTKKSTQSDVFVNYQMFPNNMEMNMHMVMAMYGVTDRLTFMTMVNYNTINMKMTMLSNSKYHNHIMNTSGLGDIKLFALFNVFKKFNHQFIFSGGFSLPTGIVNAKGQSNGMMYPKQRLPYNMQLGSGSLEVLPGITYSYQKNNISWSTQLSGVIRTNFNQIGYKLGNDFTSNTWLAFQWLNFLNTSIRVEANWSDRIYGADKSLLGNIDISASNLNYGGKKVNCFIGATIKFKKGILKKNSLSLEYGLPLYQNVNGIQMSSKQIINAAWAVKF